MTCPATSPNNERCDLTPNHAGHHGATVDGERVEWCVDCDALLSAGEPCRDCERRAADAASEAEPETCGVCRGVGFPDCRHCPRPKRERYPGERFDVMRDLAKDASL